MTPVTPALEHAPRQRNPRGQGDRLRAELIEAALGLLGDTGDPEQVSIRGVAKAAGVSATAAYRHFDDRDALLNAACGQCFEEFALSMLEATGPLEDPFDRLHAAGFAYLNYALADHGHYRVLFSNPMPVGPDGPEFPLVPDAAGTAFQQLIALVQGCLEAGAAPTCGDDPTYLAFQVWSWMHGICDLAATHSALPWPDLERMVSDVQRALGLVRPDSDT